MTTNKYHKPESWQFAFFDSKSGSRIRYGFTAPDGESKGTVVVTGGYNNPIEYYYEQINNWRDRGYTVYAMDWDGQGGSSRSNASRRDWPADRDFGEHADMFHEFVQDIVKPDQTKPAFISSHSKGGNIMLRYMKKYEQRDDYPFTAAILGAPLIDMNTRFIPKKAFRRLIETFNFLGVRDVPMQDAGKLFFAFKQAMNAQPPPSEDDAKRKAAGQDNKHASEPHNIGLPTIQWLRRALHSINEVKHPDFLKNIETPILILTPHKDGLVCVESQKWAAEQLPHGKQIEFKNARHGIWYDTDHIQKQVWREVDHFTNNLTFGHYARSPWLVAINQKLTFSRNNQP